MVFPPPPPWDIIQPPPWERRKQRWMVEMRGSGEVEADTEQEAIQEAKDAYTRIPDVFSFSAERVIPKEAPDPARRAKRTREVALYGNTADIEDSIALGQVDLMEVFRIAEEHGRILAAQGWYPTGRGARTSISGDPPIGPWPRG